MPTVPFSKDRRRYQKLMDGLARDVANLEKDLSNKLAECLAEDLESLKKGLSFKILNDVFLVSRTVERHGIYLTHALSRDKTDCWRN